MFILLGGIAVLIVTVVVFIYLLPRGGKVYRLRRYRVGALCRRRVLLGDGARTHHDAVRRFWT